MRKQIEDRKRYWRALVCSLKSYSFSHTVKLTRYNNTTPQ